MTGFCRSYTQTESSPLPIVSSGTMSGIANRQTITIVPGVSSCVSQNAACKWRADRTTAMMRSPSTLQLRIERMRNEQLSSSKRVSGSSPNGINALHRTWASLSWSSPIISATPNTTTASYGSHFSFQRSVVMNVVLE